jgi:predicted helicase
VTCSKGGQQHHPPATISYYKANEEQKGNAKLQFLEQAGSIKGIEWQELLPDGKQNWLTENLQSEFFASTFLPVGTKDAKAARIVEAGGTEVHTIFKIYSRGAETTRDSWMYDFNAEKLAVKAAHMIDTYNLELARWRIAGSPKDIDSFVLAGETKIKWSSRLKECFTRGVEAKFTAQALRHALYRPFTRKFLYFDKIMTHRQGMFPAIFPTSASENENVVIVTSDIGYRAPFSTLATNSIPDLHMLASVDAFQCFPYYTYAEDGTNRRENITAWALKQFQSKYGAQVTKWDIFHYIYALLHHPHYRTRYAENLKRDLPHIPLVTTRASIDCCVSTGKALMDLHLNYERQAEYKLDWQENEQIPFSWRVEKMRLTADKTAIIVNESLTLAGIPPECFLYRLGNRSALEWVLDQYQVGTDKRSGIVSDPNNLDDQGYIVRLLGKVITASVETVRLVNALAQTVTVQDWLDDAVEGR